jgi:hypothetical protein
MTARSKGPLAYVKRAGLVLALMATGLLSGAPAQADVSAQNLLGCSFSPPEVSCWTGVMGAHNSQHWMKLTALPPRAGTNTCRLHDSVTGDQVGIVSSQWYHISGSTITVHGLHGYYFGVCVNNMQYGSGSIQNH